MNNLVHFKENFLTEVERRNLLETIYNELSKRSYEHHDIEYILKNNLFGEIVWVDNYDRAILDATRLIPKSITEKILSLLDDLGYFVKEKHVNAIFLRYAKDLGFPELEPHLDIQENAINIDYQINSNISWPVTIDGKDFALKDNDIVVFNASKLIHWREPRLFSDGEYLDIVLFSVDIPTDGEKPLSIPEKLAAAYSTKQDYVKRITELQKTVGIEYSIKKIEGL